MPKRKVTKCIWPGDRVQVVSGKHFGKFGTVKYRWPKKDTRAERVWVLFDGQHPKKASSTEIHVVDVIIIELGPDHFKFKRDSV